MNTVCEAEALDQATLRARLAEAEETLRAIYQGEVDALVVAGPDGDQIFTLAGAETPYRHLIEAINEGALTLMPDGTIVYCNTRFAQMLTRPMEQITGSSWQKFFAHSDHRRLQELLNKAGDQGNKGEFALKQGDSSSLAVQISARSLQLDGVSGFSVLITDISERKRAEEAIRQAKEELEVRVQERTAELTQTNELLRAAQVQLQEQARHLEEQVAERTGHLQSTNKAIETLCYNMAHDLRAPNRSMQGFAELLLTQYAPALDATGQEYLRRIGAAAERNDRLILDMLTYGRLGHVPLPCSEQSLAAVLQAVLQHLSVEIELTGAKIEIKGPLPQVWANSIALEQAVENLLSNALKFVPAGVTPQVTVWVEESSKAIRLHIKDNGIGVAHEYHQRIFKVFERLCEAQKYPGTGIGLAIVEKAMERMGGRAGLESEPGQGSCFWLELPMQPGK